MGKSRYAAVKPGNNGKNLTMDVVGMDMAGWTKYLGLMLGRTVQDKTGFTERLDTFHFEYTRENLSAGVTNSTDPGDLPISVALQLQLG